MLLNHIEFLEVDNVIVGSVGECPYPWDIHVHVFRGEVFRSCLVQCQQLAQDLSLEKNT